MAVSTLILEGKAIPIFQRHIKGRSRASRASVPWFITAMGFGAPSTRSVRPQTCAGGTVPVRIAKSINEYACNFTGLVCGCIKTTI